MAKAVVYLQVEPDMNGARVWGARVVRSTQNAPGKSQKAGTVLVKITLDIPDGAFLPLRPEAVVVIPEGMTAVKPIEVEAGDANDPD